MPRGKRGKGKKEGREGKGDGLKEGKRGKKRGEQVNRG